MTTGKTKPVASPRPSKLSAAVAEVAQEVRRHEHASFGNFFSDLGERIKDARKAAKKTQKEVADAVGISRPTYINLEAGEAPEISLNRLIRVLNYLKMDISISQLMAPTLHDLQSINTEARFGEVSESIKKVRRKKADAQPAKPVAPDATTKG